MFVTCFLFENKITINKVVQLRILYLVAMEQPYCNCAIWTLKSQHKSAVTTHLRFPILNVYLLLLFLVFTFIFGFPFVKRRRHTDWWRSLARRFSRTRQRTRARARNTFFRVPAPVGHVDAGALAHNVGQRLVLGHFAAQTPNAGGCRSRLATRYKLFNVVSFII